MKEYTFRIISIAIILSVIITFLAIEVWMAYFYKGNFIIFFLLFMIISTTILTILGIVYKKIHENVFEKEEKKEFKESISKTEEKPIVDELDDSDHLAMGITILLGDIFFFFMFAAFGLLFKNEKELYILIYVVIIAITLTGFALYGSYHIILGLRERYKKEDLS
ncbi:MAG: hypothetical protein GF353_16015 [Candidatus Lokiarchaeota archaeon]|nr:hypothetical protein [Candidatus Lokiarchaeota archaeon]MBD3352303.1 hypothetical protein [Candidatus Lokiarchaeota archaeon]